MRRIRSSACRPLEPGPDEYFATGLHDERRKHAMRKPPVVSSIPLVGSGTEFTWIAGPERLAKDWGSASREEPP